MHNLQIRRDSIGIFSRQIQDVTFIALPYDSKHHCFTVRISAAFYCNASIALLEYAIHTFEDLETLLPSQQTRSSTGMATDQLFQWHKQRQHFYL